jgi:hypothetical protein
MTTNTADAAWSSSLALVDALAPYDVDVWLAAKGRLNRGQATAAARLSNLLLFVEDFQPEWMSTPWRDLVTADRWLLTLADALQPDIVHLDDFCHGALPWPAPLLVAGSSTISSWREATRGFAGREDWRSFRRFARRALRAADLVVAPSRNMLAALSRFYGPLPRPTVISHYGDRIQGQKGAPRSILYDSGGQPIAMNIRRVRSAAAFLTCYRRLASLGRDRDGDLDFVRATARCSAAPENCSA